MFLAPPRALPAPGATPALLKSAMKRCPSSSERSPVEKSKRRVLFDLQQTEVRYLPSEPHAETAAQTVAQGVTATVVRPDKAELAAFIQHQCVALMHSRERLQEQRERRLALSPSLGGVAPSGRAPGGAVVPGEHEPVAARGGVAAAPSFVLPSTHLLMLKQQQQQQQQHQLNGQERVAKVGFEKAAATHEEPLLTDIAPSRRAGGARAGAGGIAPHAHFSSCSLPGHGHHHHHQQQQQQHAQRGALLGRLATDSLLVDRERRERFHNLRAKSGGGGGGRVAPALQDLPSILKTNGPPLELNVSRRGPARGRENRSEPPRPVSCGGYTNATLLSARAIAATKGGAAASASPGPQAAPLSAASARTAFVSAHRGPGSKAPFAGPAAPSAGPATPAASAQSWQAPRNGGLLLQGPQGYLTLSRMPTKGPAATRNLDGLGGPMGPQVKRAVSLAGETWPLHVFKLQPIAC
ncbi:unnamed protein product [Lampetra planeri]